MRSISRISILSSFVLVLGLNAAPALSAHCERCADHAKSAKNCEKKCAECAKKGAGKCKHCEGRKDCAKCHDSEAKAEKA